MPVKSRTKMRHIRHARLRKRIKGTSEQPRLAIFRSLKNISAQIIDDTLGQTLCSASTLEKSLNISGNIEGASKIGELIAMRAKEKGISSVVFDRGGNQYHGRVASLAESARKAGLEF